MFLQLVYPFVHHVRSDVFYFWIAERVFYASAYLSVSFERGFFEALLLHGNEHSVHQLVETHGLSGNYLTVTTSFSAPVRNRIDRVLIKSRENGKLMGEVLPAS